MLCPCLLTFFWLFTKKKNILNRNMNKIGKQTLEKRKNWVWLFQRGRDLWMYVLCLHSKCYTELLFGLRLWRRTHTWPSCFMLSPSSPPLQAQMRLSAVTPSWRVPCWQNAHSVESHAHHNCELRTQLQVFWLLGIFGVFLFQFMGLSHRSRAKEALMLLNQTGLSDSNLRSHDADSRVWVCA